MQRNMVMNVPNKLWILQVSWLKNMPAGLKKDVADSKKDVKGVEKSQIKVSDEGKKLNPRPEA